jgi:hypothetical protein
LFINSGTVNCQSISTYASGNQYASPDATFIEP